MGLGIADLFLKNDAHVVITGTNHNKLGHAQEQLGSHCLAIPADVTRLPHLDRLYQKAHQNFKCNFDTIVVNAGISRLLPIEQVSETDFDKMVAVNIKGAFFTAQKAIPYLNTGASIIFISSLAAKSGIENSSIYCATKAALLALTKCFAAELACKSIRVNSISPGVIRTPILTSLGASEKDLLEWSQKIPLKRLDSPSEIAATALFLASEDSNYITAADFAVDGGVSGIPSV